VLIICFQSEYTEVLPNTEPVFQMPLMPLRKITITHPERSEDGNVSDAGAPRRRGGPPEGGAGVAGGGGGREREGAGCCCDGERAQDFSVSTAASKAVVKQ
jgi:hypothetical protein